MTCESSRSPPLLRDAAHSCNSVPWAKRGACNRGGCEGSLGSCTRGCALQGVVGGGHWRVELCSTRVSFLGVGRVGLSLGGRVVSAAGSVLRRISCF
eukprot:2799859-Alexandrium_andersonii.AAC.1